VTSVVNINYGNFAVESVP